MEADMVAEVMVVEMAVEVKVEVMEEEAKAVVKEGVVMKVEACSVAHSRYSPCPAGTAQGHCTSR